MRGPLQADQTDIKPDGVGLLVILDASVLQEPTWEAQS
jgi:hypothetical protein